MSESNDRGNGLRIAGIIAVAVLMLALAAGGIYELAHSNQAGTSKPIAIAPTTAPSLLMPATEPAIEPGVLMATPEPATEPAQGWIQLPGPVRTAIQKSINQQIRTRGPLSEAMAWSLSAHRPGDNVSPRWTHTLNNGVTVDLIAVGHPDKNITHWWDGDGKPVAMLPQWAQSVGGRGFVLRVTYPTPPDASDPIIERTIGESSSIFHIAGDGKAEIFFSAPAPAKGQPLVTQIGVGVGPWQPADAASAGKPDLRQPLAPASADQPGLTLLTICYSPSANVELAWAAVDKSGKTHWISSEGPISSSPVAAQGVSEQDYIPLAADRIDHIARFSRPRVWTAFSGMADAAVKVQATTQPAIARLLPAVGAAAPAAPTTSPAPAEVRVLSAVVTDKIVVVSRDNPAMADNGAESQLRMAQFHLRKAASDAFGEIASRKALSGICDPPPNLQLVGGVASRPGRDAAIAALRLDGKSWKYDVLPPGLSAHTGGVAETAADRTARLANRLDAIADDVDSGNYDNAPAMRAALLRQLDRFNAPATRP